MCSASTSSSRAIWNSRAARAAEDWAQRAKQWDLVRRAAGAGMGLLVLLGVVGNLLSAGLGYRMAADAWPRWVNGLWLAALAVQGIVMTPSAARLASLARAAGNGPAPGYEAALGRWRIGNILMSVLYLALLVLMVFRWRA